MLCRRVLPSAFLLAAVEVWSQHLLLFLETAVTGMRLCAQVEAAYDILLMQSMKRRMSGDVGSAVRFADVKRARPASKVCCLSQQEV